MPEDLLFRFVVLYDLSHCIQVPRLLLVAAGQAPYNLRDNTVVRYWPDYCAAMGGRRNFLGGITVSRGLRVASVVLHAAT